jgi:hypothetical protein
MKVVYPPWNLHTLTNSGADKISLINIIDTETICP